MIIEMCFFYRVLSKMENSKSDSLNINTRSKINLKKGNATTLSAYARDKQINTNTHIKGNVIKNVRFTNLIITIMTFV